MTVITPNPDVHLFPPSVTLGVGANLRDGVIHDFQCIVHDWRILALRVGGLVDSGECDEGVPIASGAQTIRCFFANATVDGEPAAHVAAKVRGGRARDEGWILTDAVAMPQASCDHAQRAEAWLRELEDRRRSGIDVAIDEAHFSADVASRVSGKPRDPTRPVVPA